MRSIKLLLPLLMFAFYFTPVNGQSVKQQELNKNRVKMFSEAEFANLHMWFYHEVQKMKLSENASAEYDSYLSMHLNRMARLDDKDQGNSKEEVILKLNEIFDKLNSDVKPILNEEQYGQHLEIMSVLGKAILNKLDKKM